MQKRLQGLVETDLATALIAEIVECDGIVDLDCNIFSGGAEALDCLDGSGKFLPVDVLIGFVSPKLVQNAM